MILDEIAEKTRARVEEDKKQIEQLDLGYSEIIDHQNYMTAKWLNKYKIHD